MQNFIIKETELKFTNNFMPRLGAPSGILLRFACVDGTVEAVHDKHLRQGWAGIRYHFYIRKDGTVYRGRPESWLGAYNFGKAVPLSVAVEGKDLTEAQKEAVRSTVQYLCEKYGELSVTGDVFPLDQVAPEAVKPAKKSKA